MPPGIRRRWGSEIGALERIGDDSLLGHAVGHRQPARCAVLIDRAAADHRPNPVTVANRVLEPLDDDDTAALATHIAVRGRVEGLALAGGANVLLTPATMITFSSAHMLAPDGRCKTFDAAADGYVRGEGCGVIVIKRLEDAIRDGDRIRAVIRGSAINQDGASGGLTVPNGVAQQRVIADALKRADLEPSDVGYLEAHGTGTSLGDPIEAQAAGAAYGAGREPSRPLLMGSAKTNIGHLEAAAGIAGVIKVILSLENGLLPQHLHFRTRRPTFPGTGLRCRLSTRPPPGNAPVGRASRESAHLGSPGQTLTSLSRRHPKRAAEHRRCRAAARGERRGSAFFRSRRGRPPPWCRSPVNTAVG